MSSIDPSVASDSVTDWAAGSEHPNIDDSVLFPVLPERLLAAIAELAVCRQYEPGEMLFAQGIQNAPFYVVESGRVVFFDRNKPEQANTYFSSVDGGMFIGDTSMFTGEPTVAEARAYERTRVLVLTHEQLRAFVRENSEASDLILRTLMARRAWLEGHGFGQLQVIGPSTCPRTYKLGEFLGRNMIPFQVRDTETDEGASALVKGLSLTEGDYPVLINNTQTYRNPEIKAIARCTGLLPDLKETTYDMAIVGAGPGGLAAAVYAASEGLDVVVLDSVAPGGQASTSSKIENYLGFTTGISGADLARQAVLQARKFGATLASPVRVESIECSGDTKTLLLDDGVKIDAKTVVLSTGARYRRLDAEGCERFEGAGVFYAAGHLEASQCSDKPVVVVGGGNSAGQAAVFLSQHVGEVSLVIRRDSLAATMSQYLIDRIERSANIRLVTNTEVKCLHGELSLEEIELSCDGAVERVPCGSLFVMIGAQPQTDWLDGCCALDGKGFVLSGADAEAHSEIDAHWVGGMASNRSPMYLETTRPGIFAVGDVRSGSIKRVATSVGEGSMVVAFAHRLIGGMN